MGNSFNLIDGHWLEYVHLGSSAVWIDQLFMAGLYVQDKKETTCTIYLWWAATYKLQIGQLLTHVFLLSETLYKTAVKLEQMISD